MASRGSGTSPHSAPSATTTATGTNGESFLSRKKKEIVDRSMALLQMHLDQCLDNSVSAAASAAAGGGGGGAGVAGGRVRVKRGREPEEDDGVVGVGCSGGVVGEAKRKKVNPRASGGKKFACPFSRHDPAKYKSVKTCCGPGWDTVHRVKEHVYRNHSLKNFCPRCFEHFDKPEDLKTHQRADVPCKLKERASNAITDEQERKLHARAKSHSSEEAKWEEMYRIIFPNEKVPSPYYDSDRSASPKPEKSRFQSVDECRNYLRVEIPRLVRPAVENYVSTLLEEVQEQVNRKTVEIIRDVETQVLRTFLFQEEQSSLSAAAATGTASFTGQGLSTSVAGLAAAPSPPPSPAPGPEIAKVSEMLEELRGDAIASELCETLRFDLEDFLAGSAPGYGTGCESYSMDSAYYTSSSNGGYGVGGPSYLPRY